jgi:hypothetical protein
MKGPFSGPFIFFAEKVEDFDPSATPLRDRRAKREVLEAPFHPVRLTQRRSRIPVDFLDSGNRGVG